MNQPSAKLPPAKTVEEILRVIETTDVEVLELRWGDLEVRVTQEAERFSGNKDESDRGAGDDGAVAVTAPLTGVFYGRAAPDQPPFIQVGSTLMKGQVVGLIETMKLFNEIISEVEGEVTEILVEEGDLVEANQTLLRVAVRGEERT